MDLLDNIVFKSELADLEKISALESRLNFLFVVYNEIEMAEMQKVLKPISGFSVILDYIEPDCMQHFYIGKFFKYNIVLAKMSDMGSRNVNSVGNIINKAIQIFRPRYIVMPGIAAGLSDKIKIGDVVIADKVIGYESEKVAPTEIIGRYPEFRSPRLFNLFCSINVPTIDSFLKTQIDDEIIKESSTVEEDKPDCQNNCPKEKEPKFTYKKAVQSYGIPKVYTGNYLSGEKLLDNPTYRSYLKTKFKEAMALDMEGVGVASASSFNRVYDWLIIKGISDLGDGKKGVQTNERQVFAMKNVIAVLKKVFDDAGSFHFSNLKQVEDGYRKNVLISGSQCEEGELYEITPRFMEKLAKQLIVNQFNVITGYGLGVGPSTLFGIFDGCDELGLNLREYTERFKCFAFPRKKENDKDKDKDLRLDKYKKKNRMIMCSNVEIAVFVFGNKKDSVKADGMYEELDFVMENKALILPVACTGGTAKKIFKDVISDEGVKKFLVPYFRERKKYHVEAKDLDKDIEKYVATLKLLNKVKLNEDNIDVVVQLIIELINLFG